MLAAPAGALIAALVGMEQRWVRARTSYQRGKLRKALRQYARACEQAGSDAELWRERGAVALLLGESTEAGQCLFKSADLLARRGRFVAAHAIMTQVVRIAPEDVDARSFERFLRRRILDRSAVDDATEQAAPAAEEIAETTARVGPSAGARSAGVPLVHAQSVVRAVLESSLLAGIRSDQMRYLFERCGYVALAVETRAASPLLPGYLYLVVEGVVAVDCLSPGAKSICARGDLIGSVEWGGSSACRCVSDEAALLAIPGEVLRQLQDSLAVASALDGR